MWAEPRGHTHSLLSGLVQSSRHWNAVEALHGRHGGLHDLLLLQVGGGDGVRQQVAVVLQPRLETLARLAGAKARLSPWQQQTDPCW